MAEDMEATFGSLPDHFGLKVTKTYRTSPTDTIAPKNNTLPEAYVAIVTGGASGIGEYIARSYIQAKAAGVVITGRRTGPLEETKAKLEKLAADSDHKVKVTIFSGDSEKVETYQQLKEHVEQEHGGRLDALICNAGPGNSTRASWNNKIHDTHAPDWDSMMGVNLNGPYYAAKHLIPLMLKAPSQGRTIVNIISAAVHMTGSMPPAAYSISKLGETRLSQHLGESYKEDDLQAFALHPGGVRTESSLKEMPESMHGILCDDINLAGNICVWLSSKRPEWMSGRYMAVNWDVDELTAQKDSIVAEDKFKFKMAV